ncbi:uncharacterized protein LOC131165506 isoform X2 [Malania oleifera]|uniref:uncharacterized protein LOC131165506 isoform X2 n=1 Tax=Malania oleifera TaxID=397392 RepID=UPI0025ADAD8C|nr:uncharacterized protein LOC131165506 isoform X2 [Malania oleifera]
MVEEDECAHGTASDRSFPSTRPDSRVTGEKEKRGGLEFGLKREIDRKRVKMRALESVLHAEGIDTHKPNFMKDKEAIEQSHSCEIERSQVIEGPVTTNSNAVQAETTARLTLHRLVDRVPGSSDFNSKICTTRNSACVDPLPILTDGNRLSSVREHTMDCDVGIAASRGTGLDLNAEDVSSLVNQGQFNPYKNHDHLKSSDVSECGSSTGSFEDNDPLRVWKEMKQNGFLSSSHGGIPVPKQRGRKSKNDEYKKKMEQAKREQIDKFTKIAAPSGLLNELNPGIINHVRNSKQVHSIIKALVKSEERENARAGSKQKSQFHTRSNDFSDKYTENTNDSGMNTISLSRKDGPPNTLSLNSLTREYPMSLNKTYFLSSVDKNGDSNIVERRSCCKTSCTSHCTHKSKDDILALKLSSSTPIVPEMTNSLSNDGSPSKNSVPSLSVKAATVASQWLELLHLDIKGRLGALRRSKKRVRAVIHTELPFLLSKEFSANQENDPSVMKISATECSFKSAADMHRARWTALFDQMDKALSEEEKQLEDWLNQVKEMQVHCEWGLQNIPWNALCDLRQLGTSEKCSRSEKGDDSERDLAVRAAAASIYSTCSFLQTMENVPCF